MRVLVLGATGMLGSAMMRSMSESGSIELYGTIRSDRSRGLFSGDFGGRLVIVADAQNPEELGRVLSQIQPDAVINCISPNREALRKGDPIAIIPICALLPHQLAGMCAAIGARLVHISTDGVFSGKRGGYTEEDIPDANDIYGLAKRLGEPQGSHTVTLRTSLIGHELRGGQGLLEWFLSQQHHCKCFSRAVFSGLPTIVVAQIVRDFVLSRPDLSGVYHVAAEPITKCELLRLVAEAYGKEIEIVPDDGPAIDRSLNGGRFRRDTGYSPADWPTLIQTMHSYR